MASKYVMRVVREPKPGKAFEVLDAVLDFRRNASIQVGSVTMSIFSPANLIISTTPFESLAEAEQLVEGVISNDDRRAGFDALGAMCSSTRNNLSRVIEEPEGMEEASWVQRYVFQHTNNGRRNLIDALKGVRENQKGAKAAITASANGPQVVLSTAYQSLSEIEEQGDALMNDPATIVRARAVLDHTDSWLSGIARVFR